MKMTKDEFLYRPMDPLRYYNFLPSDGIKIDFSSPPARELAARLLLESPNEDVVPLMDLLSISLVNEFESLAGDKSWKELADRMAGWYALTLRPGGSKSIRMRAQMLNFFLRDILDAEIPTVDVETEHIPAHCPWDFLRLKDEDIWLTSDKENVVRRHRSGAVTALQCGLPTRLDILTDGRIGVHSLYSNGGWLFAGDQAEPITHDAPIVLFFFRGSALHFVDFKTRVFEEKTRTQVAGPLMEQAHFARLIGERIFLIDCCQIGKLYEMESANLNLKLHHVYPVLICNDVCQVDDRFYLLDKEQGSVFLFDSGFRFVDRRLAFGRALGRLWDPVAIRHVKGQLHVLNWFTSSLVKLDAF